MARHRDGSTSEPDVLPADVLLGLLLAHPGELGEARVLLQHFGLTARDALPPSYPAVRDKELERLAREVRVTDLPPVSATTQRIVDTA